MASEPLLPVLSESDLEGLNHVPARHILLVEDNVDVADSLFFLLTTVGHKVRVVHEGAAALEAVRSSRPDVVLLDIGLPGLSGYEIARHLRRDPETAQLRLIALSGYGGDGDRRRSQAAGFDHHLVKPVTLEELEALLSEP
jgi:two-component system CheB/CheR fusion protein